MSGLLEARGYHGTHRDRASAILADGFRPSDNTYDWLGRGIYFWQEAPLRARTWAADRFGADGVVLAATIDLSGCIDFLDIGWHARLAAAYEEYAERLAKLGEPLPAQSGGAHRLDRAVMNFFADTLEAEGQRVTGVRAPFFEGEPIFPGSAIGKSSHVQIAVRDASAILSLEIVE